MNVFLARQPIYDAERRVHGYELLYRHGDVSYADVHDGTVATAQVLLNAAIDIGVDKIAGHELLFINCTRGILLSEPIVPPDRCVLEILEHVDLDDDLLERIENLQRRGYRIALDDFTLDGKLAPAFHLADYVKLDVLALTPKELERHVLRRLPSQKLIAEKVDSEAMMRALSGTWVRPVPGLFPPPPGDRSGGPPAHLQAGRATSHRRVSGSRGLRAGRFGDRIGRSFLDVQPAPSGQFRPLWPQPSHPVGGIGGHLDGHGILVAMGHAAGARLGTPLPVTYLGTALQRGYMCETLAAAQADTPPGSSFLVGLLSTLDSILDVPMAQILEQVRLTGEIREALEQHGGDLGRLLACTLAYESGDTGALKASGIDGALLYDAYWQSIDQAEATLRELIAVQA